MNDYNGNVISGRDHYMFCSSYGFPPLHSPIIRKYTESFKAIKRRGMYLNVSKRNAKRCVCCTHLFTSSVNGRQFSIINDNDMDLTSSDLIYVIA